jgi:hypothetical protein
VPGELRNPAGSEFARVREVAGDRKEEEGPVSNTLQDFVATKEGFETPRLILAPSPGAMEGAEKVRVTGMEARVVVAVAEEGPPKKGRGRRPSGPEVVAMRATGESAPSMDPSGAETRGRPSRATKSLSLPLPPPPPRIWSLTLFLFLVEVTPVVMEVVVLEVNAKLSLPAMKLSLPASSRSPAARSADPRSDPP